VSWPPAAIWIDDIRARREAHKRSGYDASDALPQQGTADVMWRASVQLGPRRINWRARRAHRHRALTPLRAIAAMQL
jgi:hypothetical protein